MRNQLMDGTKVVVVQRAQELSLRVVADRETGYGCGRGGTCERTPAFAVFDQHPDNVAVFFCAAHARAAGWLS